MPIAPIDPIEHFGKLLMENVRDYAIKNCDNCLQSNVDHSIGARWRAAASLDPHEFAKVLIPDIVDQAIGAFLAAIDQGELTLIFRNSNGAVVNLSKDGLGELTGSFMGSKGWRAKYSEERYFDDFGDLD